MDVYEELIRERNAGRMCVLATIVNAVGSVPSHATAKLLLREDGSIVGTVGGGAAEAAVIEEAKRVLASGRPKLASFDLHENPRMDIGMVCGGSLNVFIEPVRPAPLAYLFGAGHVGALTAAAARIARIDVEVIDDRPEFACAERFPGARAIHAGDIDTTLAALKPNANALIFIAGRSHELDARALRWAIDTPAFYIGMIGSRRKVQFVYHKLKTEGVTDDQLSRVHAPVGLNIGAATAEEIAISVVAEMVSEIRHVEAARALMSNMTDVAQAIGRKISQNRPDRQDAAIELRPAVKGEAAPVAGWRRTPDGGRP
ncbi:XdhC family protein [Roseiarcus sp.]|uniref:XdhC family protein n=1 Tax=Roseiarcus sp. TaxID=1969460 RepID=UPI003F9E466F